jgi:hypothetical protein
MRLWARIFLPLLPLDLASPIIYIHHIRENTVHFSGKRLSTGNSRMKVHAKPDSVLGAMKT